MSEQMYLEDKISNLIYEMESQFNEILKIRRDSIKTHLYLDCLLSKNKNLILPSKVEEKNIEWKAIGIVNELYNVNM